MLDAREHGAKVLTYHEVIGLIRDGDTVRGVTVYDHHAKKQYDIYAEIVVNAGGIWGKNRRVWRIKIKMFPAKGRY